MFYTVRELYDIIKSQNQLEIDHLSDIEVEGWIRTNRSSGKISFIELNDGSFFKSIQVVYREESLNNFTEISSLISGAAINVKGQFKLNPSSKQGFEIEAQEITIEANCANDFPLQKKRHSYEYLREIAHLRPRTNTFAAVFRVRSVLSMAIHEFFQNSGFVYLHSPIITGNDAEGAGEVFSVTTKKDNKYTDDFFGKSASLTVSGQLHAEAFALAFRDVYTFGPTFRAENSNTSRHASEFWMVEPEIAFANLEDDMNLIEDMVKYCIQYVLCNAKEEIEFFNQFIDQELITRLETVLNSEFKRLTYTDAIEVLKNSGVKFEKAVEWGMDLQSEHERYLCEQYIKGPVFLIDYPKDIKAFYMRLNDDGKTVAACDLLVPYVGELVGGSQREERYNYLVKRVEEINQNSDIHINLDDLAWYMDLRKYGGVKHAGFGLGLERFVMYLTGMSNIRDVLPYPRTPRNLKY